MSPLELGTDKLSPSTDEIQFIFPFLELSEKTSPSIEVTNKELNSLPTPEDKSILRFTSHSRLPSSEYNLTNPSFEKTYIPSSSNTTLFFPAERLEKIFFDQESSIFTID